MRCDSDWEVNDEQEYQRHRRKIDRFGNITAHSRKRSRSPTLSRRKASDVVVVRALTDSATYNMLELPTGRLAKINPGDLLLGMLGRRPS